MKGVISMMNFRLTETGYDDELFVLCLNYDSILNYVNEIENQIVDKIRKGKIIVDQLFVTGNGKNRFIECEFVDGQVLLSTAKVIKPTDRYLSLSKEYLVQNRSILDKSILTSIEKNKVLGDSFEQ